MSKAENSYTELREEIQSLREDIDELRRMLVIVAGTVAMVEGQQNESHTYLKRVLAELKGTSTGRQGEEYTKSEKLTSDLERGLKIMADRAEEMGLPDLVEYLRE